MHIYLVSTLALKSSKIPNHLTLDNLSFYDTKDCSKRMFFIFWHSHFKSYDYYDVMMFVLDKARNIYLIILKDIKDIESNRMFSENYCFENSEQIWKI